MWSAGNADAAGNACANGIAAGGAQAQVNSNAAILMCGA